MGRAQSDVVLVGGFMLALIASMGLAGTALVAQRQIGNAADARHAAAEDLLTVERLRTSFALASAADRGYLLTGEPELRDRADEHRAEFSAILDAIRAASGPQERVLVGTVADREKAHGLAVAQAVELMRQGASRATISGFFSKEVVPRRELIQKAIRDLAADRGHALEMAERSALRAEARTFKGLVALSTIAILAIVAAALFAVRSHSRERSMMAAWTRFLSIASHDLKTPLSTLTLRIQLLERLLGSGTLDNARLKSDLGRLRDGVEQMAELVRSVLDLSRLRAGSIALDPQTVDLAKLVGAVAERIRDDFERAGVELTILPVAATGIWDPKRIEQVVTNLLSNALKYGQGRPVEIRAEQDGDWVRLSVTDHGQGIPPAEQAHIFKPFTRLSHQNESSHGLGLFIVDSIVQAHSGHVHLTSAPDAGSTFIVELPCNPKWAATPV
jgi:signal transduction histidine kinase